MSLDENVKYITEQKKLLEEVLSIELERRKNAKLESDHLASQIKLSVVQHSELQRSLSGVIPSELMAHAREIASLEQELKNLNDLNEYTSNAFGKLKITFEEYQAKNKKLNALKSDLTANDQSIIKKFESRFKEYLKELGYVSYDVGSVVIDKTTLFPRILIDSVDKIKRIKADSGSSASDSVRMVTAYTLALHACKANSVNSMHPNVSVFDEPAQQNMDIEDHLKFFDIVADVCNGGGQVIVAATDKDHSVKNKAESLNMSVIDFGDSFILA